MDIIFHVFGMPFDGETVAKESLGGSETAAYYLAREMAIRGHKVKVFTSGPQQSVCDDIAYLPIGNVTQQTPMGDKFEGYMSNTPCDVLIVQRVPYGFHKRWAAKICLWQLHDLALMRTAMSILGGLWQNDVVTTVSDWHGEQVKKVWNINPAILRTVPNGVDPALYEARIDKPAVIFGDKVGRLDREHEGRVVVGLPSGRVILLYQSRPERGLAHLVRPGGIMDRVRDLPVHLVFCGYENTTQQMAEMYAGLYSQAQALPNVTNLGPLPKPVLAELQRKADLLLYPTEFEEVSCITAMEAMHAKLPMLTSECAALVETCKDSGTIMLPLKDKQADEDAFVAKLHELFPKLAVPSTELRILAEKQAEAAKAKTWERAGDRLLEVIEEAFAKRRDPGAVLRHAIEHSDIDFAKWYIDSVLKSSESTPLIDAAIYEIDHLYSFVNTPESYRAQYEAHQSEYYDAHEEAVIGEDVTGSTRFRGVLHFLAEQANRHPKRNLKVLDYGCAHGHYLIPLAKTFPQFEFHGVDITERAIAAAKKWQAREKVENIYSLNVGDQSWLEREEIREEAFDVIIAGEVLEHAPDLHTLLDTMRATLANDGVIIATTPLGRWEHSDTDKFRVTREHLRMLERDDIVDLAGSMEVEILHAPAAHDRSGAAMSSWVWALWEEKGAPLGKIDYARKLRYYGPRQTVSVCMIVRNAEDSLRRSVASFIDWVDEVIICIDETTTDRTPAVVEELISDYPNRPIRAYDVKSPTDIGFDEARNFSISKASGEWILWCDSDEEIRTPWNMHRVLKPSMHNGYGYPQVHYAVDPDTVLTTDFPVRLFRNHIGVQFFGVVHEHPETEMGKAVPWAIIRQDMKFLHAGYYDEETRRNRFKRNWPLLVRELKKHPDRALNGFLHLRDLAQGIGFNAERMQGYVHPALHEQARKGIEIFERIAEKAQLRLVGDALQYYSVCVGALGLGFEAKLSMATQHPISPDLSVSFDLTGRFHSRDFYLKVVNRFAQESTTQYEAEYL